MELHETLTSIGVETKEAKRLANLVESANKNELLYMLIFMEGMKAGALAERLRQRNRERDKNKIR